MSLFFIHLAANDGFTIGTNLLGKLAKLGGAALVLFVGFKAAGHVASDRYGAAVGIVIIALIPAWFLLDPQGASSSLQAGIKAIGG